MRVILDQPADEPIERHLLRAAPPPPPRGGPRSDRPPAARAGRCPPEIARPAHASCRARPGRRRFPQRRQRRAELVGGVGEEAPLRLARPVEAAEHRVEGRREPADLVVDGGLGQPPAGSAVRSISAARRREPLQRTQRAAQQERDSQRRRAPPPERNRTTPARNARRCPRDRRSWPRRSRPHRRPAPQRSERRDVQTDPITCRVASPNAGVPVAITASPMRPQEAPGRPDRGSAPRADRDGRAPPRSLLCPPGSSSAPGAVNSAGTDALSRATATARSPQGAVQGVTELTLHHEIDGDPERDDREQDRQRRRDHRATADRQPGHARAGTDAPYRLDQRRIAELPPEIRDVAIDDVEARCGRPTPDPVERHLARDDVPGVAEQQLEQVCFSRAEIEVTAGTACRPRPHVEDDVADRQISPGSCPRRRSALRRATNSSTANGFTR